MPPQRLKELKEAGAKQQEDLQRLQKLCGGLEQDREAFKSSLDRAEKLHIILQSRYAPFAQAELLGKPSIVWQPCPALASLSVCLQRLLGRALALRVNRRLKKKEQKAGGQNQLLMLGAGCASWLTCTGSCPGL